MDTLSDTDPPSSRSAFEQAMFPVQLNLPPGSPSLLQDAAEAVKKEYRDSVKWKRLNCRDVKLVSQGETGTVFLLEVGHAVEFDWTWEGAIAFRPLSMSQFNASPDSTAPHSANAEIQDSIVWAGEVLEVDETAGRIYICVPDPDHPPIAGWFYIRPFEFLAFLHALYHEPPFQHIRPLLPARLAATAGGVHPDLTTPCEVGLPILRRWWRKSWSILWGPPGTGKTYTTGHQAAQALLDPTERILIVSTTNRATDAAAIALGRAARLAIPAELNKGHLLRAGKGASLGKFRDEGLAAMLKGTETEYLAQVEAAAIELARTTDLNAKALLRLQIRDLRRRMGDAARENFLDKSIRTVVSTAFRATMLLRSDEITDGLTAGIVPFTTVFIDEAGLMSRAAIAALSLLAAKRVVLVGDSKQLAPISRISRVLPRNQMTWLANSGLSHLESLSPNEEAVHLLQEQRRMHADICKVVSSYQYEDRLKTAPEILNRAAVLPEILQNQPRAIWYVLDESGEELPTIRAERGPGNRSWMRLATGKVLTRLFADRTFRSANGLFISPFKAQAKAVGELFAHNRIHSWGGSTVHSQQGAEADIVIFDTVNAGSYGWSYDEWKRLVNVALSRAREVIIVLASRAEMDEPYLRPLLQHLAPMVLRAKGGKNSWEAVAATSDYSAPGVVGGGDPNSLGNQLEKRKALRPVLSHEQQRLCGLDLDGKPRLVRGVAGSGKTAVLAHWLVKTVHKLKDRPNLRIWAVFANRSLQSLMADSIAAAWQNETGKADFPWGCVSLRHIRDILSELLPLAGLSMQEFEFEYDQAAAAYLTRMPPERVTPCCDALFIDEAQDLGPSTLKLLTKLVERADDQDVNSRSVNIFYDNAQNIYGRGTPVWSELGLDMRGRSTVMKESFRSTKPITEFALNVLYQLQPPENNPDHKELIARGLVERTKRMGKEWWEVRFNQVDGPKPVLRQFAGLDREFQAITEYCVELIEKDGVKPSDIVLLYNGSNVKFRLESTVAPALARLGVELSVQTNKPFLRSSHTLLATTSHSFKGYDAEVVIIPAADQYVAKGTGILANNLYVAMTRARSILTLFTQSMKNAEATRLYEVFNDCLDLLHERPAVDSSSSYQADLEDLLPLLGREHRKWLMDLWSRYPLNQDSLQTASGEVIAQPVFWIKVGDKTLACFGTKALTQRTKQRLQDHNVDILVAGDNLPQPV